MRNKRSAATLIRLLEHARYEVLPTASTEDKVLEHVPRDRVGHGDGIAGQGPGGDPRPRRAARRARLRRGAPPRGPDGHRPDRARRRSRTGSSARASAGSSCPAATPNPAGDYPDALALLRGPRASSGSRSPHVGITGYPESHPTIHDDLTVQSMWDKRRYATHIVSNLTFDPALVTRLDAPAPQPRRDHAAAARHPGAGRARQAARHGHQDRGGGVDQVPRQEQGAVRPARGTRRLHRRALPGEVRTGRSARRVPSSRACTSSPSTRSPRPRPGAPTCSGGSATSARGRRAPARGRGRRSPRR